MNKETKIPQGWQWVKLGTICHTTSGGTPSRKEPQFYNGKIPWVKSGELDKGLIIDTEEKISEEAIKNSSAKVFPKGTLLIALYGATIGKLAFLGVEAATNQAICGIYQNENINSQFLYNYLFHKKQKLVNQGIGGAQPNISQTILKDLDIPLPPMSIQISIVSKIEELFSELDKGVETLRTTQQQLKTYRQAVLSGGTNGMFTGTGKSYSNIITIGYPKSIKKQWRLLKLTDVAKLESGHTPRKDTKEYWENGDIYWLSLQDIRALDGKVAYDTKYKTNKLGIENSSARLLPIGTVCFCRDISVGYVTIMGKVMSTTQHFANWICNEELNNRFLMYAFMASRDSLIRQGQGTTVKTIYMPELKELRIQLPPISEQLCIVQEIESRFSVAEKMEESISQSLQQAEALKQSILKKAFEGRLFDSN